MANTPDGPARRKRAGAEVVQYAEMMAAMGAEPRLRIVRLLLEAHPDGLAAGDIGAELEIPPSTLSHHLDRLKREDIVHVRRKGTFLWYTANTATLEGLMRFLFAECCTRSSAIQPERLAFLETKSACGHPEPRTRKSEARDRRQFAPGVGPQRP